MHPVKGSAPKKTAPEGCGCVFQAKKAMEFHIMRLGEVW